MDLSELFYVFLALCHKGIEERGGGGGFPLCIKNPHLELFSLPQRYFTSQYKRPPIDDFVELIIENLEK